MNFLQDFQNEEFLERANVTERKNPADLNFYNPLNVQAIHKKLRF